MIVVTVSYFGKCASPDGNSPWIKKFRSEAAAFTFALAEEEKVSVRRVDIEDNRKRK